ncbi:hypothetical protein [Nocardioides sp.]|uniref:hypothetical protein n=1 Tax=Nocardioides sp. TaxID=35761 RepID=UPI0035ADB57F
MLLAAIRTTTVAALAACLIGLSAGAASADRWWGADREGDVAQSSYSPEPPPCGTFEQHTTPQDASTDIVGLSVRHEGDTVEMRAHLRNLTGWGDRWVNFEIQTDRRPYSVHLTRNPSTHPRDPWLMDASDVPSPPDECGTYSTINIGVPCEGLTASVSSREDYVAVVIPRSCLGSPRWVEVGLQSYRTVGDRSRFDRWRRAEPDPTPTNSLLGPLGPRVRHSR